MILKLSNLSTGDSEAPWCKTLILSIKDEYWKYVKHDFVTPGIIKFCNLHNEFQFRSIVNI